MKSNLTSPRYRATIDLDAFNGSDARFLRLGILRLSPGQWVTTCGMKARFVRMAGNSIWIVYGTSQTQFRLACKKWLKTDEKIAA